MVQTSQSTDRLDAGETGALSRGLTPPELSRRWRCRVSRVRAMIRKGELAAISIDGNWRIMPEAIRAAEQGTLAVRPARRQRRETVSAEIRELLGEG